MGKVVLAIGASHAPQMATPPEKWPEIYELVTCAAGPDLPPLKETLEDNRKQFEEVKESFAVLRKAVEEVRPDVILAFTDDHFDNFFLDEYPPYTVYLGSRVDGQTIWIPGRKFEYKCDANLEKKILDAALKSGFDLAFSEEVHLEYGHVIPLSYILPKCDIPIVPFFTNAYAHPQPEPKRCYEIGKFLAQVIRKHTPPDYKVALLASGGLSHYPGEPEAGQIDIDFDNKMMRWIKSGNLDRFARLTSRDIDKTGNTEMRNWIVMMGMLGNRRPSYTNYVISWRAIIGLGFVLWRPIRAN